MMQVEGLQNAGFGVVRAMEQLSPDQAKMQGCQGITYSMCMIGAELWQIFSLFDPTYLAQTAGEPFSPAMSSSALYWENLASYSL